MDTGTAAVVAGNTQGASPVWWIIGVIILLAVGFFVIPPLMKKMGNKLYKRSSKKITIDVDKLGPEIVKKEKQTRED